MRETGDKVKRPELEAKVNEEEEPQARLHAEGLVGGRKGKIAPKNILKRSFVSTLIVGSRDACPVPLCSHSAAGHAAGVTQAKAHSLSKDGGKNAVQDHELRRLCHSRQC